MEEDLLELEQGIDLIMYLNITRKGNLFNRGQINFENEKLILPGETDIVTVEFLNLFGIEEFLTIGRKWWIHEAAHKIGEAEIIQIYKTL